MSPFAFPLVSRVETITLAIPAPLATPVSPVSPAAIVGPIDAALESLWSIEAAGAGEHFVLLPAEDPQGINLRVVRGPLRRRSRPMASRWPEMTAAAAELAVIRDRLDPGGGGLTLVTTRPERARRFYRETLGLRPVPAGPVAGTRPDTALPAAVESFGAATAAPQRALLTISAFPEAAVDPERASWTDFDGGVCLVSLASPCFDAAYAAVDADRDALVLARPRVVAAPPYDHRRAFCFLGPDGERIEIVEALP